MESEQKQKLKQHIKTEIEGIKKGIASFKKLTRPIAPDNAIGRLTRMEAINSKSINEAALSKLKNTLPKLERALIKIDAPEFGLCGECEEPIPFARLMIMPQADLCVQCAEERNG